MTRYLKKNSKINTLDPSYINAFEELKILLTTHPILKYPDFDKEFKLCTDASKYALGAVLLQEDHPIAFASRTLNNHEINYSTTEKELLAIVWAVKYFRPYLYGKQFELKTDHQPLKWLHTKYLGKDLSPRLQRWILSLGEYNMKIEYLKGKDNKIADFLSRINTDTHEINNVFEINENSEENNDNVSIAATIHSQEENLQVHIPIMETIVNRFKTQLIITDNFTNEFETIHNNRRIYINQNSNQENFINKIKTYISTKQKVAIYTEIPYDEFNLIQQMLIREFPSIKFIKCQYFAQDIISEEELIKIISIHHKEQKHPGIIALYEFLKYKIYNPKIKYTIHKITNNCSICNQAKYDRNPIKPKFKKTEIPTEKNQIIHVDIYTNKRHQFLIFIDKFSKFATAYPLEHKNYTELIEKFRIFFNHKKPNKIVADNDFKHINIKEFLNNENIELHLTKPNSHTGNADVERLNNTITEKLRILNLEQQSPIRIQILEAIKSHNNTYHSTIKTTPNNVEEGNIAKEKIYENIIASQNKRIDKLNKKREDYNEIRRKGYIKNYKVLRHKDQPKYRKYKLDNVHPTNIKRPLKFTENNDDTSDSVDNDSDNETRSRSSTTS